MKSIKSLVVTLMMFGTAFIAAGCGAQSPEGQAKSKVVYHVNYDDDKQQSAALRNIQNHINAEGADNVEIRVVMHGAGVSMMARAKEDMNLQSAIVNLKQQKVAFNVCNNTLVGKKINYETDLFDVTKDDIVPSGVAELARLQAKGFAYIKP